MIRQALSILALCSVLPAFAASHPVGSDAASTPGVDAVTAWTAAPSAAPMLMDTPAEDADDSAPDDFKLLTVPEPATLAMFGAGLLGVLGIGYRRRRR